MIRRTSIVDGLTSSRFLPDYKPCQGQLLRWLIAMHYDVLDEEQLRGLLADELQLVVELLYGDQLALDHGEQVRRLRRLRCVRSLSPDGPDNEAITLRCGPVLHWNWHQHWLQEEGRGVMLRVGVADSPECGDLFRRCEVARGCRRGGNDGVFRAIGLLLRDPVQRGLVECGIRSLRASSWPSFCSTCFPAVGPRRK